MVLLGEEARDALLRAWGEGPPQLFEGVVVCVVDPLLGFGLIFLLDGGEPESLWQHPLIINNKTNEQHTRAYYAVVCNWHAKGVAMRYIDAVPYELCLGLCICLVR